MTPREHAVAGLAEDVGKALLLFAERLRVAEEPAADVDAAAAMPDTSRLGGTQLRLFDAIRASGDAGLSTKEAADRAGMSPTNAPRALRSLRDRGLITAGDGTPAVWRSTPGGEAKSS